MSNIVHTYELLEQLGQGGMGVVYKARHIHFDKIYAIKRLWEQFSSSDEMLQQFMNEARILGRLEHRNIVRVVDVFSFENKNYIVMEYVKGRSLDQIIKREVGPIRRERALKLFKQMLEGIAYIHEQYPPVIHRDIKPLNILVTDDDTIKIADFGIAKALDPGHNSATVVKGTPVYMSPEQMMDPSSVDIRTDIYSLGMTFYEMLAGKTPFAGVITTTPTAIYAAVMDGRIAPPTHFYPAISDALSAFVMRAMNKNRNERFYNAREMLRELERLETLGETLYISGSRENLNSSKRPVWEQPEQFPHPPQPQPEVENSLREKISPEKEDNSWKWLASLAVILAVVVIFLLAGKSDAEEPAPLSDSPVATNDTVYTPTPAADVQTQIPSNSTLEIEMVQIPDGNYYMGSNSGEPNEQPVHQVSLSSFMIAKYEVTQAQWENVMGYNPSFHQGPNYPVEQITWNDAIEFCNRLSEKQGLQKVYYGSGAATTFDYNANGYRLPTEAEWEYAARGGAYTRGYIFSGSNNMDDVGWYSGNTGKASQPVGLKSPNEAGLYDMSGNVWEWCWDRYGDYSGDEQTNPYGASSGSTRLIRGGSWYFKTALCTVSFRSYRAPTYKHTNMGFRVARTR